MSQTTAEQLPLPAGPELSLYERIVNPPSGDYRDGINPAILAAVDAQDIEQLFAAVDTILTESYDSLASEGQVDIAEPNDALITLEELYALPALGENQLATPQELLVDKLDIAGVPKREKRQLKGPPWRLIAHVAMGAAVTIGALVGAESLTSATSSNQPKLEAVAAPVTAQKPVKSQVTPTTTIETTTTTAPAPVERRFEKQPGELIGTLKIPALCEDIQVFQFDEIENVNKVIGTGSAVLDRLTPDPSPELSCENVEQFAQNNPGYKTRMDWVRNSANGHVNQWEPVAGQPRNEQGPLSVYPGQPGNAVIAGHGSTFSAPFADTASLKPGDPIIFERADGAMYMYEVVNRELTIDYNVIYGYSNVLSESTLSLYNCADANGRNGSETTRSVVRAVLVKVIK